jgi:chromosome partitioning protein
MTTYTLKKIQDMFGQEISRSSLIKAENLGKIPSPQREQTGAIQRRSWSTEDLPAIGEKFGFLKKPVHPAVITVFTPKGGVLKSSLTINIGRMAALHNIKTVIVGLDFQGDVTSALGFNPDLDESSSLEEALDKLNSIFGLFDFERGDKCLSDLIHTSDIPTLHFIPETPELQQLDQAIKDKPRREFWLKEKVIEPLKQHYDLVIIDCSPNWNQLVTNALAACDLLISPIECKINNFRNFKAFRVFIEKYKADVKLTFDHMFIPTRLSPTRKLSSEIRKWYLANIDNCTEIAIREGIHGEEAMASYISVPEFAPNNLAAQEMRQILMEIWAHLETAVKTQKNYTPIIDSIKETQSPMELTP